MKFIIAAVILAAAIAVQAKDTKYFKTAKYDEVAPKMFMDISPEGTYKYEYETPEAKANEEGHAGVQISGKYSYMSPEGIPVEVQYTADENGFHPTGEFVPKVPEYVGRALAYIAAHPYVEPTYVKKF